MNSKLRIVSLALGLGLAGVVTVTWGAESVVQLISHGEVAIRQLKSSRAAYQNADNKNKELATEGQQIAADTNKLNQAISDYKKQAADLNQQINDFKARCNSDKSDKKAAKSTGREDRKKEYQTYQEQRKKYEQCKADQEKLAKAANDVNAIPAQLNKQQAQLKARSAKYNKDVEDFKAQAPKLQQELNDKLNKDEDWLNKVRNFVASPAVQPYAKKAHCPDTKVIAKNISEVIDQSDKYLACLKKIAGT